MVISCSAYKCRQRQQCAKKDGSVAANTISFHRFPMDSRKRELWIKAVRWDKWKPSKFSYLCSKHFKEEDYETPPGQPYPRLKRGSVPSVFDFPPHLKIVAKPPRREIKKHIIVRPKLKPKPKLVQKIDVNKWDHTYCKTTIREPSQLTLKLRKKVKTLQQKIRRRNQRALYLKDIVETVNNEELLKKSTAKLSRNKLSSLTLEKYQTELENCKKEITSLIS